MDTTLLLTLVGTILAIYTILPENKKLRVNYAFGKKEIIILLILIIILFVFLIGGLYLSLDYGKDFHHDLIIIYGINLQFIIELIYLTMAFIIFIWISYILLKKDVKIKNKKSFSEKIDDLYDQKKYGSLINLLDETYEDIFKDEEKNHKFG